MEESAFSVTFLYTSSRFQSVRFRTSEALITSEGDGVSTRSIKVGDDTSGTGKSETFAA